LSLRKCSCFFGFRSESFSIGSSLFSSSINLSSSLIYNIFKFTKITNSIFKISKISNILSLLFELSGKISSGLFGIC